MVLASSQCFCPFPLYNCLWRQQPLHTHCLLLCYMWSTCKAQRLSASGLLIFMHSWLGRQWPFCPTACERDQLWQLHREPLIAVLAVLPGCRQLFGEQHEVPCDAVCSQQLMFLAHIGSLRFGREETWRKEKGKGKIKMCHLSHLVSKYPKLLCL